ncbi:leukocyte receptor cluster member 1 homolog [Epargyreus clarus]|uniref:leukocyte receptor cluster member 1 homolog n=1 Tax=Epargyreus clarus TaxID=520877 RepID=UPI003C2BDBB3
MNILPKKRWHVRTKENIARVRKDEAEAAEKERKEQLRIENADREARLNILKNKSKQRLFDLQVDVEQQKQETTPPLEHVNLFADLDHATTTTNKEHDIEVKEKKEEYEKKIGYLTYLGQDTNEALGKKNWYEVLPQSSSRYDRSENIKDTYDKLVLKDKDGKARKRQIDEKDGEIDWKLKQRHDPVNTFRKYCEGKLAPAQETKLKETKIAPTEEIKESNKNSKHKKSIKDKDNKLQQLREARLKREQQEKQKTEMFLTQLSGGPVSSTEKVNKVTPKYNSQFNPELARQNYR